MPFEIQAKVQTVLMKSTTPVERASEAEIMPFNGDAHSLDIAVKRAPAVFDFAPRILFGCALTIHSVKITGGAGWIARKVYVLPAQVDPIFRVLKRRHRRSGRTQGELYQALRPRGPRHMAE